MKRAGLATGPALTRSDFLFEGLLQQAIEAAGSWSKPTVSPGLFAPWGRGSRACRLTALLVYQIERQMPITWKENMPKTASAIAPAGVVRAKHSRSKGCFNLVRQCANASPQRSDKSATYDRAQYITLPKMDEGKCKAIGTCVEVCPEQAIEMRGFHLWVLNHEYAVLAHPEWCTGCGACVQACPVAAWSL